VAYWQQKSAEQQRLIDWLKGKEQMQVRGENIDLTLSIKDRVFINADGKRNFPDGEIYTGPVEDSANGWVRFASPAMSRRRAASAATGRCRTRTVGPPAPMHGPRAPRAKATPARRRPRWTAGRAAPTRPATPAASVTGSSFTVRSARSSRRPPRRVRSTST